MATCQHDSADTPLTMIDSLSTGPASATMMAPPCEELTSQSSQQPLSANPFQTTLVSLEDTTPASRDTAENEAGQETARTERDQERTKPDTDVELPKLDVSDELTNPNAVVELANCGTSSEVAATDTVSGLEVSDLPTSLRPAAAVPCLHSQPQLVPYVDSTSQPASMLADPFASTHNLAPTSVVTRPTAPPPATEYYLRDISYLGHPRTIVCQNTNGPCPLIALCNVR